MLTNVGDFVTGESVCFTVGLIEGLTLGEWDGSGVIKTCGAAVGDFVEK